LQRFDKAFNELEEKFHWMKKGTHQYVTLTHEGDKLIVFEKGDLLFIFNFHPSRVRICIKGINIELRTL